MNPLNVDNIEKITVTMQIGGKVYFLCMSQERLNVLLNMAAGLADNNTLNLTEAPEQFSFTTMGEVLDQIKKDEESE